MLIVKCPECGKDVDFHTSEFRPFCSERCKLLDLGAWADERYSLPAEATTLSEEDIEALERAQKDK
jgi:endogenous inhibitor of DNA gyrase (YacG/DUF329 family)